MSLRVRSIGCEVEIKTRTDAEVDRLVNSLGSLQLDRQQQADFEASGFDDGTLLLQLGNLAIADGQAGSEIIIDCLHESGSLPSG
jgi:hypothetical protein